MNSQRSVLLTVSGRMPDDLAEQVMSGRRPRADYEVLSEACDADLIDVNQALATGGRLGRVLYRLGGPGPLLAWACFRRRRRYEVIVTDGEQVGLPLALLHRVFGRGAARHFMIVHILSTRSKATLIRVARLAGLIDRYLVYCSWQRDFIQRELGVDVSRIVLSTFMVDTAFFDPDLGECPPSDDARPVICSAGLERRDYPTLMRAVSDLDIRVVIAAASPWSTRDDSTTRAPLPPNVEIRRLSLFELRELYAQSVFVVMPLEEVNFQAGITTILEAMSMRRPVLVTRTPGQTDTVVEGENGRYVPPGDVSQLRAAIVGMLEDRQSTEAMGRCAREWVVANADIETYAARLAAHVRDLAMSPAG